MTLQVSQNIVKSLNKIILNFGTQEMFSFGLGFYYFLIFNFLWRSFSISAGITCSKSTMKTPEQWVKPVQG